MSVSFYLRCNETRTAVHVAEQSSDWFRGADHVQVVGAFCVAHEGKTLDVVDADHFDNFMECEIWTPENMNDEFMSVAGHPLIGA